MRLAYSTVLGKSYIGNSIDLLKNKLPKGKVNLVITSPPFALLRKKEYGNKNGKQYISWLTKFAKLIKPLLTNDGSFVLDLGGAYQKGKPIRSLYNYRILLKFCDDLGYHLAEEFFWYNPSKLPSPIEWVNKRKIRAKDSVDTIWWFSKNNFPKANTENVLVPYSNRMKHLLRSKKKFYSPKLRPSGHNISNKFNKNNGGALPSNLLVIPNTDSNSEYLRICRKLKLKAHPARFPYKLPEFFIKFLTNPGDLVVDIFSGSNTTGMVANNLNRKWISCDIIKRYVATSSFRFCNSLTQGQKYYQMIMNNKLVKIPRKDKQLQMKL